MNAFKRLDEEQPSVSAGHPNTFEPVKSIDQAKVARNTIYLSPEHPSKIILPAIAKDAYLKP